MISTLEEALMRIKELEEENKQLLSELEYYRNRNYGGRKKHNEAWMVAYNDFAQKYEGGMTIMEIVAESEISLLFLKQNSPLFIPVIFAVVILIIVMMVVYIKIEAKYKK